MDCIVGNIISNESLFLIFNNLLILTNSVNNSLRLLLSGSYFSGHIGIFRLQVILYYKSIVICALVQADPVSTCARFQMQPHSNIVHFQLDPGMSEFTTLKDEWSRRSTRREKKPCPDFPNR